MTFGNSPKSPRNEFLNEIKMPFFGKSLASADPSTSDKHESINNYLQMRPLQQMK